MYRVFKSVGGGRWILYRNKFTSWFDAKEFVDKMSKDASDKFKIVLETDVRDSEI